ncbi:MAG: M56 family metallopeptidase, partial [Chroococcales cyanobacterium]
MHLVMISIAIASAYFLRFVGTPQTGTWNERWQRSLFFFLLPPLLLIMTAFAVLVMGTQGKMLGLEASELSYDIALAFVGLSGFYLIKQSYQGWRSQTKINSYPQQFVNGKLARIVNISFPYCAQIGFWKPQLIITQGLLSLLDIPHLEAVFAHEKAHFDHRDPFCFFWLGWLKSLTFWLPNTETLWQELLLLREMRADQEAAQSVDPLLLAESLILVAKTALTAPTTDEFSLGCSFGT